MYRIVRDSNCATPMDANFFNVSSKFVKVKKDQMLIIYVRKNASNKY